MAETVLTSAHTHALQAATALKADNFSLAAVESQSAATDFARATRSTADSEALRILKLLEEEHRRLARLCKARDANLQAPGLDAQPSSRPDGTSEEQELQSETVAVDAGTSARNRVRNPTVSTPRTGKTTREGSSLLARDIASRRGIPLPQSPSSAATSQIAKSVSPKSVQLPGGRRIPPSVMNSRSNIGPPRQASDAEDDQGFTRFYNNLATGTMSKLSSVLAYAGLPLATDNMSPEASTTLQTSQRHVRASNEPDVKKIFSKGALRAIEDEHRQRGTLGRGFGPAESFYMVQPTGGTVSYAEMAKIQQQQQLQTVEEDDDAAFVDAREAFAPNSPTHKRFPSGGASSRRSTFGKAKTGEELELENTTLKATLELLNSRLAAFESHAQDASMAALTQSMATLRPPPRVRGQPGQGSMVVDTAMSERVRQLEEQLEKQTEDGEELRNLAAKQERELKKWNKRFDTLQANAKEKARAKREMTEETVSNDQEPS